MTAREIREEYFIPGSPVILANTAPPRIGTRHHEVKDCPGCDLRLDMPFTILRMATFEEYLATVKPEHRRTLADCDPAWKYFYEVSVD